DRLQAVQARLDGFTFSRFSPYLNWLQLVTEGRRLWEIFVKTTQPQAVQRVAVRYINQINIPISDEKVLRFEDYLQTCPVIGPQAGQDLEQFFMRLILPQKDLAAQLILTEALLPAQGSTVGVILDIDLFRENASIGVDSPEIWSILDEFRSRKNRYFEASITENAR